MSPELDVDTIIDLARRLRGLCGDSQSSVPIAASAYPAFSIPDAKYWRIPELEGSHLLPILEQMLHQGRERYLRGYLKTVRSMASIECLGGPSDIETERHIGGMFEQRWSRLLAACRTATGERLGCPHDVQELDDQAGKGGGFSSRTMAILEAAYARTQVLTQRECSILAGAASITHQQVRTWFQNKRNREARRQRVTSQPVLSTTRPTPAPVRRIVSLPKRGKKAVDANAPPPVPTHEPARQLRQLPRRAAAANVASYFETNSNDSSPSPGLTRTLSASSEQSILSSSSLSSLSSLSSIHPTGGFASSLYPANSAGSTQVTFPIDLSPAASSAIGSADPFLSGLEISFSPSTPIEEAFEQLLGRVLHSDPAQLTGQPDDAPAEPRWASHELVQLLQNAAGQPVTGDITNGPLAMPLNGVASPASTSSSLATSSSSSELSTSSFGQCTGSSQVNRAVEFFGKSSAPSSFEQMFGLGDDFYASLDTLLNSPEKTQPPSGSLADAEKVVSTTATSGAATSSVSPDPAGLVLDTSVSVQLNGQANGHTYVTPELTEPSPSSARSSTYLVTPDIGSLTADDLDLNQFQQLFNMVVSSAEIPTAAEFALAPIPDLVSGALLDPSVIPLPPPTEDEAGFLGFGGIERDLQAAEQPTVGGVWDFSDLVNFD